MSSVSSARRAARTESLAPDKESPRSLAPTYRCAAFLRLLVVGVSRTLLLEHSVRLISHSSAPPRTGDILGRPALLQRNEHFLLLGTLLARLDTL